MNKQNRVTQVYILMFSYTVSEKYFVDRIKTCVYPFLGSPEMQCGNLSKALQNK